MAVTKKIRQKNAAGAVVETDIGALAKNITQDASNRFVSDTEKATWNGKTDDTALNTHKSDTTSHITANERNAWNAKTDDTTINAHKSDTTSHITATERNTWNAKQGALTVDTAMSAISTNPVQNKVIQGALDGKSGTGHTHGTITSDGKVASSVSIGSYDCLLITDSSDGGKIKTGNSFHNGVYNAYLSVDGSFNQPMVTGIFNSQAGGSSRTAELGFQPSFVLVRRADTVCNGSDANLTGKDFVWASNDAMGGGAGILILYNGFMFIPKSGTTAQNYAYVAFR